MDRLFDKAVERAEKAARDQLAKVSANPDKADVVAYSAESVPSTGRLETLRADFHRPGGPRGGGEKAEADTEAEHLIRGRLAAAFPTWSYLGEETGGERLRRHAKTMSTRNTSSSHPELSHLDLTKRLNDFWPAHMLRQFPRRER